MKEDIKQKFIDILFESDKDDKEETIDAVEEEKHVKKEKSPIKAKDILYRKSENTTFINYENKAKTANASKDEVYELTSQISPMFGVIRENKHKNLNVNSEITDTQTSKPETSHLDIITSPIYGYGSKEDAIKNNYEVKGIPGENDDEELHQVFNDEDSEYENYLNENNTSVNNEETDSEEDFLNFLSRFGDND